MNVFYRCEGQYKESFLSSLHLIRWKKRKRRKCESWEGIRRSQNLNLNNILLPRNNTG